jgi:hypothetical protein
MHAMGKKNRGLLELAKPGQVKMVMHRQITGTRHLSHGQTHSQRHMVREYHGGPPHKASAGKAGASFTGRRRH